MSLVCSEITGNDGKTGEFGARPARRPAANSVAHCLKLLGGALEQQLHTNARIRVRADVDAAVVVHVPSGVGAVLLLGRRQRTRREADDDGQSNGGLVNMVVSPV